MSSSSFETAFARYLEQAIAARDSNRHHDYRRQVFLGFLDDAFGIKVGDVEVEQYLQIADKRVSAQGIARVKKGWIDAVFRDLIFEFKRDLDREKADGLRELRDYLTTLPNGAECVGLLTDGLTFIAYTLAPDQPGGLREGDKIDLEKATPALAFQWLDAYLLKQRQQPPTSADMVRRFGLTSPTFVRAASVLRAALRLFAASEASALEVKRQQWAFHLARVYGSADASNDEMFVRHTYLCQFAKILAYTASFGVQRASDDMEQIIDGRAFEVLGVSNVGEQDFFAWTLAPEVRQQTLAVFRQLAGSLLVYDLTRIHEDLLKQLYQNLVEPETRHELGEFYTPDWLAELTLREIGYRPGQSLLDPACGSGTFLFLAIRLLAEQGVTGAALVDFALEHIMGMDVHPLAVTIARINYMLAILPHLRGSAQRGQRAIPIFLANSLQMPTSPVRNVKAIEVSVESQQSFKIPVEAARHPGELTEVLEQMGRLAARMARRPYDASFVEFGNFALSKLPPAGENNIERSLWSENAKLLTAQIARGRDSIWLYILQNTSRPLILQHLKFDVVIGNPPWIAYRYLQDQSYQRDVKTLIREYGLLASNETKLNTVMELATLFFEHCRAVYLKPGGTIAFVLPRSVITGAKQHRVFQEKGFSRILDLQGVAPLFGVECCVMILGGDTASFQSIPTSRFAGTLPAHECTYEQAIARLTRSEGVTDFAQQEQIASPYYHPRMINGATLYPRNLVFVTSAQPNLPPGQRAISSIMQTDPDVDEEAKAPWKGLRLQGHIDEEFLYATLLSKQMVPFGVRRLHLVALPIRIGVPGAYVPVEGEAPEERFLPMSLNEMRDTISLARSADEWFEPAEQLWEQHKKATTKESLAEWLNYQNKITAQSARPGYLVVYNAAGSNIASAVIDTSDLTSINGAQPRGFVLDHTAYWYRSDSPDEVHFLSALLNAPCVDAAIKIHQTRGLFGARHIHRRPFEVCPIPPFDADNADHRRLAALSQEAHALVAALDLTAGGVVAARKRARQAAHEQLAEIDLIARRLLNLAPAALPEPEEAGEEEELEEAEE